MSIPARDIMGGLAKGLAVIETFNAERPRQSIAEVAASVGFLDQFYFSRVFKRAKGVPPSKYFAAQADAPADGPDHQ